MSDRSAGARSVVVVGSVNTDVVTELDRLPKPGETLLANRVRRNVGGKGANQAVAAGILDDSVAVIARVGADADGEFLTAGLTDRGIDTAHLRVLDGEASGAAYIAVAGGQNTIVVVGGANRAWDRLTDDEVSCVAQAAVVVCQLEIPQRVVDHAAASTTGRFVLNAAPAGPVSASTLSRCDPLIANEYELAELSAMPTGDVESAMAAATFLRERGARSVVATLGAAGAVWIDAHGAGRCRAPAVDVIDSTGAGDLFVGVVAARLASGDDLDSAVRWAVVGASMSVTAAGTLDSYPDAATLAGAVDGPPNH